MLIPYFETWDEKTLKKIRGFYFEYPETTYCFSEDYKTNPVKLIPCLVSDEMSDWGMPNHPVLYKNINKDELIQIGYIDTIKNTYEPMEWIKATD